MNLPDADLDTIMEILRVGDTYFVEDVVAEYLSVLQKLGAVAHVLAPTFLTPNDNKVKIMYVDDV